MLHTSNGIQFISINTTGDTVYSFRPHCTTYSI